MSTKTRTAKTAPETDKAGGYKGSAQIGIVTFLVGTLIAVYLFLTNPDPKSFEEYNFVNTGLCLWLPLMTILFVFRQEPNQFGLTRGDQRLGFKWVLIAWVGMILPLVWYSHQDSAKQFYLEGRLESSPLYGLGTVLNPILHTINYKALLYFELGMGFYMFCWEFFFRGFLLFGLQKSRLGSWGAVIIQSLLFMLLHSAWKDQNHAAKPLLETLSALPGGIILGILALKTRSFVYGFLAHWAISVTLDLFLLVPFISHHFG
jgi:membrane protease YdiL (CAAX protease family)